MSEQIKNDANSPSADLADYKNEFNVQNEADGIHFVIPGTHNGRSFELQGFLPRDLAVNFAAWLALKADPAGHEFVRVYNEIKKT